MSADRSAPGFPVWQGAADASVARPPLAALERVREATGILRADAPTILARVRDPWVGLALWRRSAPAAVAAALDSVAAEGLSRGRLLTELGELDRAVDWLLQNSSLAGTAAETYLRADIAGLAARFARLLGTELVDLRLEAVGHDACWKYHRDNTRLRLITTYRGPGTQIVAPEFAACALREQRAYRGPMEELPRFAVALFKGSRADRQEDGIVHRSPPVAGSGQTRLVLCLNERSEASPPLWRG